MGKWPSEGFLPGQTPLHLHSPVMASWVSPQHACKQQVHELFASCVCRWIGVCMPALQEQNIADCCQCMPAMPRCRRMLQHVQVFVRCVCLLRMTTASSRKPCWSHNSHQFHYLFTTDHVLRDCFDCQAYAHSFPLLLVLTSSW